MYGFSRIFGLFACIGLLGCNPSAWETPRTADQGTLEARLRTAGGASKAAQTELEIPSVEAFGVSVRNAAGEEVYAAPYADFPYSLNLTEGNYTIEARSGQNVPFATEDPYYFVQKTFAIERGSSTSVELTATLVPFGVEGVFDADMADHFASWRLEAEVDDVWDAAYAWAANGSTPRAYFLPARVRVILRGVRRNGAEFSQVIKEVSSAGRELYTLKIHVLPAGHGLSVTVDTERRVVTDTGIVSPDALPDLEAPTAGELTFYETSSVPSEGTAATAVLHSWTGFSDIELTIPKDGYGLEARAYRWHNADDRAALRAAGVELGADDLSTATAATLDAKRLVGALLADAAVEPTYGMGIKVLDATGKEGSWTLPVRIERPEFTVNVPQGNVWSKTIELSGATIEAAPGKGSTAALQASGLVGYEFSADGGATWRTVALDERIAGLTPGATYMLRGTYRSTPMPVALLTTEQAAQIPNSDFESWQDTRETKGGQPFFRWKKEEQEWWASLNTETCTSSGIDSWQVSQSSTRPAAGYSGHGVQVATVGYGSGNTWAGFMWSAVIYNTKAGRLFVGSYNGGQQNGKPFASRPTAMTYWYKWAKHPDQSDQTTAKIWIENREGNTVTKLGEGSFTTSSNVGAYTQKRIDIAYVNTTLPATHICIEFQSGQNDGAKKYLYDRTYDSAPYPDNWYYYGSRFWVDEVELIYDK